MLDIYSQYKFEYNRQKVATMLYFILNLALFKRLEEVIYPFKLVILYWYY